jgi:Fe-S cluster biogenesis protein NfuA
MKDLTGFRQNIPNHVFRRKIMATKEEIRKKVEEQIEIIRPRLQEDGGDITLISVDDDYTVKVRLEGACRGCPMSAMTLQMGVERVIRQAVPEIKGVVNVPE